MTETRGTAVDRFGRELAGGAARMPRVKHDHVEHVLEQWRRERPDIDASPMGVVARISRLARILDRRVEEGYAEFGLNTAQFNVLAALRRAGPPYCLTPTSLYHALLVSSGAMTNRLDRLTAAGYVRRIPDPSDGRSVLVALTPKGKRLIDRMIVKHYDDERELLASVSPEAQKRLAAILRKLLLEFEDHPPPADGRNGGSTRARSSRRRRAGSGPLRTTKQATRET
ncbi:MAG: MarR family transcriptional regulator [Gaiella sp.]|nr:MarR family transcriptional regulator [Gaiella sp.]